jgi:hypothetical protein
MAGASAITKPASAQFSIKILSLDEHFGFPWHIYGGLGVMSLDANCQGPEMTVGINAFVLSVTIFKYNESVIFSISRLWRLRWQHASWACPYG